MKQIITSLALFFIHYLVSAQTLTSSAANDFLSAFQNDDSVQFKMVNLKHQAEITALLNLAASTNCNRIFSCILEQFPDIDSDMPILLALTSGNQEMLSTALDKNHSLGEYSVNNLLSPAWSKNNDDNDDEFGDYDSLLMLLPMEIYLPKTSFNDYLPLLFTSCTDEERVNVALWLIEKQQEFDFLDLPKLKILGPEYNPVVQLLKKKLRELHINQSVYGFESLTQLQVYSAVLENDLSELKALADDVDTFEFNINEFNLLFYAVKYSNQPIIKFLLSRGANANWHNEEYSMSILKVILARGDPLIFQEVIPHIQNTEIQNDEDDTPIISCLKSFYNLAPIADNFSERMFYLKALKELRNIGANFNHEFFDGVKNTIIRPINFVPERMDDSLARSVAILVLEHTSDQIQIANYSSKFNYLNQADKQIITLLSQKLNNINPLFYNKTLEEANLFPFILKESVRLPDLKVFSSLLRSACYYKDVQKVRWLLNDVPLIYAKRNYSLNSDSLRRVIVNSPVAGDGENVLYYFLKNDLPIDWSSKSILKALMAAGSDLYQMRTFDNNRPIDLLLTSASYQKHYINEILSGLLLRVKLNCDSPSDWEKEPSTGNLYRKSILVYQRDKIWLQNLKNCVNMDLNSSALSPAPNRRVNITGIGSFNLGTFPVQSCDPINIDKLVGSPPNRFSVYEFKNSIHIEDCPFISTIRYWKDASSLRAELRTQGNSGLQNMQMSIKGEIAIPATKLNASEHAIPPIIIIRNSGDPVVIHQNNVSININKNEENVYDRSKGPLQIEYQRNSNNLNLKLEIFGRIHDTKYPDLIVPNSNDVLSRLFLYAEILRLQDHILSNPGQTEEERIYRRHNEVVIHLLSEYTLQRGFPKKVKEEYEQNLVNLGDINQLIEQLGRFYEQHSVLDFNDVPQLNLILQALINEPLLTDQQRNDYIALVQRLEQAGEDSELWNSYGQLMNSELLQLAVRQLDEKSRLDLEIILYDGHLKLEE